MGSIATLINVYYNNFLVLSYTGDIINNVFNGNPMVYWGFTASTGGLVIFIICIDVPDLIIDSSNLIIEGEKCDQENGSIFGINISGGINPYVGLGIIQIQYLLIHLILMVGIIICKSQMEWGV